MADSQCADSRGGKHFNFEPNGIHCLFCSGGRANAAFYMDTYCTAFLIDHYVASFSDCKLHCIIKKSGEFCVTCVYCLETSSKQTLNEFFKVVYLVLLLAVIINFVLIPEIIPVSE